MQARAAALGILAAPARGILGPWRGILLFGKGGVGRLPEPTSPPPGGGVIAQALISLLVSAMVLLKTPATPFGIVTAALAIVLVPWIPTFWGFGDAIAASIVGINVAAGAFTFKTFVSRTGHVGLSSTPCLRQ